MRNMRILVFAVLVAVSLVGCKKTQINNLVIRGQIERLERDTLYVTVQGEGKISEDVIVTNRNGKFVYKTYIDGDRTVIISPGTKIKLYSGRFLPLDQSCNIELYVKPGDKLNVNAKHRFFSVQCDISGSPINEEFSKIRLKYADLMENLTRQRIKDYNAYYKKVFEIEKAGNGNLPEYKMSDEFKSLLEKIKKIDDDFVKNNPNSQYSAYRMLFERNKEIVIEFYENLSDSIKSVFFGKKLGIMVDGYKRIKTGAMAPDIVDNDINGNYFRLSDLKGKYVLIDFWGTWCGWCIRGVPQMIEYHKKYKGKIEYVSIACNESKGVAYVKNVVDENNMNWINLLNGEGDNDYVKMLSVTGYPTKILIDPEGMVVQTYVGESPDLYAKLDMLMKK